MTPPLNLARRHSPSRRSLQVRRFRKSEPKSQTDRRVYHNTRAAVIVAICHGFVRVAASLTPRRFLLSRGLFKRRIDWHDKGAVELHVCVVCLWNIKSNPRKHSQANVPDICSVWAGSRDSVRLDHVPEANRASLNPGADHWAELYKKLPILNNLKLTKLKIFI